MLHFYWTSITCFYPSGLSWPFAALAIQNVSVMSKQRRDAIYLASVFNVLLVVYSTADALL